MIYSLAKPIQSEDNDVKVDLRPKVYYPNNNNAQSINFPYGTSIPVEYDGVLPWIAVRKPTKYKVESCELIALTSEFYWDTYGKGGSLSKVEATWMLLNRFYNHLKVTYPISAELSCLSLGN